MGCTVGPGTFNKDDAEVNWAQQLFTICSIKDLFLVILRPFYNGKKAIMLIIPPADLPPHGSQNTPSPKPDACTTRPGSSTINCVHLSFVHNCIIINYTDELITTVLCTCIIMHQTRMINCLYRYISMFMVILHMSRSFHDMCTCIISFKIKILM